MPLKWTKSSPVSLPRSVNHSAGANGWDAWPFRSTRSGERVQATAIKPTTTDHNLVCPVIFTLRVPTLPDAAPENGSDRLLLSPSLIVLNFLDASAGHGSPGHPRNSRTPALRGQNPGPMLTVRSSHLRAQSRSVRVSCEGPGSTSCAREQGRSQCEPQAPHFIRAARGSLCCTGGV